MTTPTPQYNPNVPLITDSFADWQVDFIQNFQVLYNAFNTNHIPLDSVSNAGNHTYIELVEQESPQQVNVSEMALYTKDVIGQTDQLFMRYQGNGTEFQYTNYQIYSIDPTPTQTFYFTFLPGGLIVFFGLYTQSGPILPETNIYLKPEIAKNIVSVNLTPSGNTNSTFSVAEIRNTDGIVTALSQPAFGVITPGTKYYTVVANI